MITFIMYLSEALIVLCVLMMVGFGLRGLILGRKNYIAMGSMALALVVFLISLAIANPDGYPPINGKYVTTTEVAVVFTAIAMFGLAILALLVSAVRGLFR
ncbi:MAG: hypothetical protein IIC18_01890 [Bacteroidetes bacterium]|nr:hypothetical protein [Bacteroidota bacterium]MCH8031383.1 hypothetical protein [Bacteroidota bacterium]